MKKTLLYLAVCACSFTTFAATPYPYYPFRTDLGGAGFPLGTAYSVPDAAISSRESLRPVADAGSPLNTTYAMGLRADYFDQATNAASTFLTDYNKTCGRTFGAADASSASAIRGWINNTAVTDTSDYNTTITPFLAYNANPGVFRLGGGWYSYTVNITETGNYEFLLRTRWTGSTTSNVKKIQIFKKSDYSTPIKTIDFDTNGIDYATEGAVSTDTKVTNLFSAKILAAGVAPSQAVSMWVALSDIINITEAGTYVIKIIDVSSGTNSSSIGGFTLLKKTLTGLNSSYTKHAIESSLVSSSLKINQLNPGSVISLFSVDGKCLRCQKADSESESIDMSLFKKGAYLVKVKDVDGKITVDKIMKN